MAVPFPTYDSAMQYFGGNNDLGRAWADGLEQRTDGLWPRWNIDVMLQTMVPIFEREYWRSGNHCRSQRSSSSGKPGASIPFGLTACWRCARDETSHDRGMPDMTCIWTSLEPGPGAR